MEDVVVLPAVPLPLAVHPGGAPIDVNEAARVNAIDDPEIVPVNVAFTVPRPSITMSYGPVTLAPDCAAVHVVGRGTLLVAPTSTNVPVHVPE